MIKSPKQNKISNSKFMFNSKYFFIRIVLEGLVVVDASWILQLSFQPPAIHNSKLIRNFKKILLKLWQQITS